MRKKAVTVFSNLSTTDRRKAEALFDEYKDKYHIDKLSDLHLLEELIFREVIQSAYQEKITAILKKLENVEKADGEVSHQGIPREILEGYNKNSEYILALKEKLGLFITQEEKDLFEHWHTLEEKFNKWCEDHINERLTKCPHCSGIFVLKYRTENYEAMKTPFFEGSVLLNKPLINLFIAGKITKEEAAEVLGVSPDYIVHVAEKISRQTS